MPRASGGSVVDLRAKLSRGAGRERLSAVALVAVASLVELFAACEGGAEETPHREQPAYRAVQALCQQSRDGCGPEGLCEARCADGEANGTGCQRSCEPHLCLTNDWSHGACIRCCAGQAYVDPGSLSRCQRECAELYEL